MADEQTSEGKVENTSVKTEITYIDEKTISHRVTKGTIIPYKGQSVNYIKKIPVENFYAKGIAICGPNEEFNLEIGLNEYAKPRANEVETLFLKHIEELEQEGQTNNKYEKAKELANQHNGEVKTKLILAENELSDSEKKMFDLETIVVGEKAPEEKPKEQN